MIRGSFVLLGKKCSKPNCRGPTEQPRPTHHLSMIFVAFDCAGSFPTPMFERKTPGVDFVAWERAPFRAPNRRRTGEEGEETFHVLESRTNRGDGRGRIGRLNLLTSEKDVVSVVAHSKQEPARLLRVMLGRWKQQNGLRHGVLRWGLNPPDGRRVEPYDPNTIIANPDRRRLDRELDILRVREGEARRTLARARDAEQKPLKRDIDERVAVEVRLQSWRQ
jgi:hypothetical protein